MRNKMFGLIAFLVGAALLLAVRPAEASSNQSVQVVVGPVIDMTASLPFRIVYADLSRATCDSEDSIDLYLSDYNAAGRPPSVFVFLNDGIHAGYVPATRYDDEGGVHFLTNLSSLQVQKAGVAITGMDWNGEFQLISQPCN